MPGDPLDLNVHSALLTVEQSNSSVAFGEDSLMKVFRQVTPGANPDIEIHRALTAAGNDHAAALLGWLDADPADGGEPLQLAMLQRLLTTASDGWGLALASVRDLFAEGDLYADEVGGDFAGESHRLGEATAEVHRVLAERFPTAQWGPEELKWLAEQMTARLGEAVDAVPALAPYRDRLAEVYAVLHQIDVPVPVQRVHGDFHLGQTLRTVRGWKIVDFEGEPAKPLTHRVRPDSPWRDVAGMLRSLDYAPHAVEQDFEQGRQIAYRAQEWTQRNQQAFLDGYLETSPASELSEAEQRLLTAYASDKAVYEVVYEARNRPGWVSIPLSAISRATAEDGE